MNCRYQVISSFWSIDWPETDEKKKLNQTLQQQTGFYHDIHIQAFDWNLHWLICRKNVIVLSIWFRNGFFLVFLKFNRWYIFFISILWFNFRLKLKSQSIEWLTVIKIKISCVFSLCLTMRYMYWLNMVIYCEMIDRQSCTRPYKKSFTLECQKCLWWSRKTHFCLLFLLKCIELSNSN